MTRPAGSPALLTDHYELTMLQAALANGTADRRSAVPPASAACSMVSS